MSREEILPKEQLRYCDSLKNRDINIIAIVDKKIGRNNCRK